ncbi:putative thiol methyltransferase 2 [Carex littledalei]|uniref:Putative thiol methyltransferase 2 n=1 Tax=Carex littledalei TaxID=544730 RepID=A0A833V941_9POAL|nr:putative thiol methyltransferase 2 [Carex littledalei]
MFLGKLNPCSFSMRSIFPTLLKSPQNSSALLRFLSVGSAFGSQTLNPKPSTSDSICSSCTSRLMKNSPISGDVGIRTDTSTGERYRDPSSNPKVSQLREVIGSADATDAWEKSWEEGIVPWDLGKPTPIVTHLVQAQSLPKGRVLVPGCGTGYDVVALAGPERYVVGLDISDTAIKKAKESSASSPNKEYFSFLVADFFNWNPPEPFNLIFDYTFFCAFEPALRSAWAKKVSEILKPEGELITLVYVITDQKEGPPFNNDVSDYEEVLKPLGFKQISVEDNELAVKPRKGTEKLVRWKRSRYQSNL